MTQIISNKKATLDYIDKNPDTDGIEIRNALAPELPAYSPDLNPIEKCWANFKKKLRKIIKKSKNIFYR